MFYLPFYFQIGALWEGRKAIPLWSQIGNKNGENTELAQVLCLFFYSQVLRLN
jgi:hypothetical protein